MFSFGTAKCPSTPVKVANKESCSSFVFGGTFALNAPTVSPPAKTAERARICNITNSLKLIDVGDFCRAPDSELAVRRIIRAKRRPLPSSPSPLHEEHCPESDATEHTNSKDKKK